MEEIKLYPFQMECVDGLRDGIRAGHRAQILAAPTGAGKTVISAYLCKEAHAKGSPTSFIVDRVSLVDQTSAVFDRFGIPHGIIQADNERRAPWEPIQICSAQTIEKRGFFPNTKLVIVDECHSTRKAVTDLIKNTKVTAIGLTATPFTRGLGEIYSNVVNVTTTNDLIAGKYLVPLKMYAAKAIDMTGAKVVAGEWTDSEIEARGMEIIGDIVNGWAEQTNAHFGGPAKTIVFAASVDHGAELCSRFQACGYNFQQISYRDGNDDRRRELIAEFRKPNSVIDGLVACEVLSRGFDVTDVMVGISARPYRKSLSSHIQQMGRVMRSHPGKQFGLWLDHCIASGQRVLTDKGLIPIEQVTTAHRLWDGVEFVTHGGVVSRGIKPVIQYAGLTATADHPVKTASGWETLGECSRQQIRIVTTGVGRTALRERDHYFTGSAVAWTAQSALHSCALRVRWLWVSIRDLAGELAQRTYEGVPRLQPAETSTGLAAVSGHEHEATLHQPEGRGVAEVRRPGDRVPFRLRDYRSTVDRGEPWDSGESGSDASGQDQQRGSLRAGESSLGELRAESVEHPEDEVVPNDARLQDQVPARSVRRLVAALFAGIRNVVRGNREALEHPVAQTKREVWDVLDCGPRNRFTCEGLLVHNSGNALRFLSQTEDVFENGVGELSADGLESKAPREPTDEDKAEIRCAGCGFVLQPAMKVCPSCGRERVRRSLVEAQAGVLVALGHNGKPLPQAFQNKVEVWHQLIDYSMQRKPNAALAKSFALAQFKNIYGQFPEWGFDPSRGQPPTDDVIRRVRANLIRYAKGRAKGRLAA